jgi:NAD(P)-dependent dehydrogenase (short-subunit alcohol dehydrogenase family)
MQTALNHMTLARFGFRQLVDIAAELGCVGVRVRNGQPKPPSDGIAAGRPGRAVTILTMAARVGRSFLAPCAAARAALTTVTRNAANALRRDRIRVNGINCGWMDTPGEDVIQRKSHSAGDGWRAKAEAAQPFGRLVTPAHVAALAAFLLSDASGVMTGTSVDVDQNVSGAHPG